MTVTLSSFGFTETENLPRPEDMSDEDLKVALNCWPPAMANAWGVVSDHGRQRYLKEYFRRFEHEE
jgi:hypothetical protein